MRNLLISLGKYKDGIAISITIILVVVGGYKYFDSIVDKKIQNALSLLKRRESSIFVDARTTLLKEWVENQSLYNKFSQTDDYTDDLYEDISKAIWKNEPYRKALYTISSYYNNAAACALDGVCDGPTMCASLAGEIQDHLDINRPYFVFARMVRKEDAKSLILSLPEFVDFCIEKKNQNVRLFSRHDRSIGCRINLYLERLTGVSIDSFCKPLATDWEKTMIKDAEKLEGLTGEK